MLLMLLLLIYYYIDNVSNRILMIMYLIIFINTVRTFKMVTIL